jgi:hypothetical protein
MAHACVLHVNNNPEDQPLFLDIINKRFCINLYWTSFYSLFISR